MPTRPAGHVQVAAWLDPWQIAFMAHGFSKKHGSIHWLLWHIWSVRQSGSIIHSTEKYLIFSLSMLFKPYENRQKIFLNETKKNLTAFSETILNELSCSEEIFCSILYVLKDPERVSKSACMCYAHICEYLKILIFCSFRFYCFCFP